MGFWAPLASLKQTTAVWEILWRECYFIQKFRTSFAWRCKKLLHWWNDNSYLEFRFIAASEKVTFLEAIKSENYVTTSYNDPWNWHLKTLLTPEWEGLKRYETPLHAIHQSLARVDSNENICRYPIFNLCWFNEAFYGIVWNM